MLPLCSADPKSIAWSSNSFHQSYSTVPGPLVPLLGAIPPSLVDEKVGENVARKSWTTRPSITSTTRMKSTRHVAEPNFTDADAFCKNRPVFRFLNRNRIPLIGQKVAKTLLRNFFGANVNPLFKFSFRAPLNFISFLPRPMFPMVVISNVINWWISYKLRSNLLPRPVHYTCLSGI